MDGFRESVTEVQMAETMKTTETAGWCWNDVITDLIAANQIYNGRIGYIIEFENGLPEEFPQG